MSTNRTTEKFTNIEQGTLLVVAGALLTILSLFFPWVRSTQGNNFAGGLFPQWGIDMLSTLPFGPSTAVVLATIAVVSALVVEDPRARYVEGLLGLLMIAVVVPFVRSPGFDYPRLATVAGETVLATGIGVYITIGGALAIVAGTISTILNR